MATHRIRRHLRTLHQSLGSSWKGHKPCKPLQRTVVRLGSPSKEAWLVYKILAIPASCQLLNTGLSYIALTQLFAALDPGTAPCSACPMFRSYGNTSWTGRTRLGIFMHMRSKKLETCGDLYMWIALFRAQQETLNRTAHKTEGKLAESFADLPGSDVKLISLGP